MRRRWSVDLHAAVRIDFVHDVGELVALPKRPDKRWLAEAEHADRHTSPSESPSLHVTCQWSFRHKSRSRRDSDYVRTRHLGGLQNAVSDATRSPGVPSNSAATRSYRRAAPVY